MSNKIFNQLGGIISIRIHGMNPEKIINLAASRGIFIWDIKKDKDSFLLKVRSSALDAMQNIVEENNYDMEIIEDKGLPFFKKIARRRLGFIGGALLFIIALYIMSSFVWFVEVNGNSKVEKDFILFTAARHGVYRGALKSDFSCKQVEKEMLREIPELTYIEIDLKGVKANINVVEKIIPQKDITGPCNIVSNRDGVIENVLVLEGQAKVKSGDVVNKGDILISGIMLPSEEAIIPSPGEPDNSFYLPTAVRARGIVKAHVQYEGYGECSLYSEKRVLTGEKSMNIHLITPYKKFLLKGKEEPHYEFATVESSEKQINTPWGKLGIIKTVFQEEKLEKESYTEKEAEDLARQKAIENLQNNINTAFPAEALKVNILSRPSDSIVRVKVSVEIVEDIAIAQPIQEREISQ